MKGMKTLYQNLMNTEPARLIAGIAATLIILVNVAAYFLPQLDGEAAAVLTGAISAIVAVIAGESTRRSVYSPETFKDATSAKEAHMDAMSQ